MTSSTPATTASTATASRPEYGSDVIVDLLRTLGVEYVAGNPGATYRGIHDSIVNHAGNERPEFITCTHEEISVAIAHGYAKATGRVMAAGIHNVVGLQHASMAIFNAYIDRAPALLLGGTGPMDATLRRPWIDWIHTAQVQGNLVRDYVKWDDQPASLAAVPESLFRAQRIALTQPYGPVYVCFDSEIQEQAVGPETFIPRIDPAKAQPPRGLQADEDSLEQTVSWLLAAERPVIIADYLGRSAEAVRALTELADLAAVPVIDAGNRQSFLNTHPMDLTGARRALIDDADLVLAFDVYDLAGALTVADRSRQPLTNRLRSGAKVVHYTLEGLNVRALVGDVQALAQEDLRVAADSALAVPALVERTRERLRHDGDRREMLAERHARLSERHHALRAEWQAAALAARDQQPLASAATALAVWEAIGAGSRPWRLANGSLNDWTSRLWQFTEPGLQLGRSGGAGVGYGPGAALGVALAHRHDDTLVVDLQSDGDLLYAPGALWTAAHHQIPLLIVMWNNRTYFNSEEHARFMARTRNRPMENTGVGIHVREPQVDYAGLARSFGVHGEGPVDTYVDLLPALERAVAVVRSGRPALVDVVSQPR